MNPHGSPSYGRPEGSRDTRCDKVVRDLTWDRPVFRPPTLGNPPVAFESNPFRLHSFVSHRPAAGR